MSKNRLFLIIQREYLSIVAKKSFIFMTLLMPLVMVLLGAIPVLLSQVNSAEEQTIAVVDNSGLIQGALANNEEYHFIYIQESNDSIRSYYNHNSETIYAIVVVPQNVLTSKKVSVFSENTLSPSFESYVERCLNEKLSEVKMSSYNLPELDKIIKECNVEVNIDTVKWSGEDEETSSSAGISMVIGLILSLVTYMFVLMYGAVIMSAVIEEKTNRIIEVIVSTCKPVELMLGKIIGVGLVGLTQILIWSVILGIIGVVMGFSFMPDMSDATMMSNQAALTSSDFGDIWNIITGINYAQILFFFVLYFIGGYLLYASLFAAFGSAVDQASDASQFTTPVMMIIIAGLYVGMACIENPNGQLAFWSSMIPFTSPIVMMIRLPFDTPVWEMILSLAILYGSVALIVYFSAKIYRTGILLYGKKNSVKDLFKWLKY